jgi:hypothetical protein
VTELTVQPVVSPLTAKSVVCNPVTFLLKRREKVAFVVLVRVAVVEVKEVTAGATRSMVTTAEAAVSADGMEMLKMDTALLFRVSPTVPSVVDVPPRVIVKTSLTGPVTD